MLQIITPLLDAKSGLTLAIFSLQTSLYLITKAIYNVYFHPLSRFPGPISHAISRLPYCYRSSGGTLPFDMLKLHEKFGDIVRIAPDELAFSHPDAWRDVMGHKNGGLEMGKAAWFYRPVDQALHIVNEDQIPHKQLRRQMAHGFSEKGMREQESMMRQYVDKLLIKLGEFAKFGDLAFGEPFGCLDGSNYDDWVQSIFDSGRLGTILSLKEAQQRHTDLTKAKMLRRMAINQERPDLIEGLLRKKDELGLDVEKLVANAEILIIGGSETTASLLSGVTYLLLTNSEAYEELKNEVRSTFKRQEDINLISVNKLSYMLACLDEGMRMYPPIANGLPRVCPKGGSTVMGQYIPENTFLSIHQWALYRRQEYFREPNEYHPERWMGSPHFTTDRRDVFQPFHLGPRNCLGRNLAYSEMRLILALIIFKFDMRIADDSRDWISQKNFLMWQKGPLKVYLTPRAESL